VHTSLYVRVRETGERDLFLGPLEGRGQRLVELTEGCYSEGDSQVWHCVSLEGGLEREEVRGGTGSEDAEGGCLRK